MFSAANIRNDGIVKLMLARRMPVLTLVPGLARRMQNSMKRRVEQPRKIPLAGALLERNRGADLNRKVIIRLRGLS